MPTLRKLEPNFKIWAKILRWSSNRTMERISLQVRLSKDNKKNSSVAVNNQIRLHTTHADLWLEFILCTSWSACCWHCSANVKRVAIPTGLICDTQRNEKHEANNKRWWNQVWKTYTAMTTASNPCLSPKPWQPLPIWDWAQCNDNHWQSGLEPKALTTIGNLGLCPYLNSLDHQATQGPFYAQGKTDTETNFVVIVRFTTKKKKFRLKESIVIVWNRGWRGREEKEDLLFLPFPFTLYFILSKKRKKEKKKRPRNLSRCLFCLEHN